jgi:hypothetical protein
VADFRSERMPTPEGEGNARDAWDEVWTDTYRLSRAINERIYAIAPWLKRVNRPQAGRAAVDLVGFWVMWHLAGGFDGVQQATSMSRAAMYRRIALFREVFGEHPDVFRMPGVTIDLSTAVRATDEASASDSAEKDDPAMPDEGK